MLYFHIARSLLALLEFALFRQIRRSGLWWFGALLWLSATMHVVPALVYSFEWTRYIQTPALLSMLALMLNGFGGGVRCASPVELPSGKEASEPVCGSRWRDHLYAVVVVEFTGKLVSENHAVSPVRTDCGRNRFECRLDLGRVNGCR